METILDHLKRMKELSSIYECLDDQGRSILIMAAAKGRFGMVKLLSNYQGLDKNKLWRMKDETGKVARDYAKAKKYQEIVDFFDGKEEEEEEEEGDDGGVEKEFVEKFTDLTKIKTVAAGGGTKKEAEGEEDASTKVAAEDADDENKAIAAAVPKWPEVIACLESAKLPDRTMWKRDLLVCRRKEEKTGGDKEENAAAASPAAATTAVESLQIDPAMWRCVELNVLKLEFVPGSVRSLPNPLGRLRNLGTLIVSGNLLDSLPDSIGELKGLKILEAAGNKLKELPVGLSKCESLEVIDVSGSSLSSLQVLAPLTQLVSVHADGNDLTNLDGLTFDSLERLVDLSCSNNKINEISSDIGMLSGSLMTLNLSSNELTEVPGELGNLQKKLQKMLFAGNPIKDPRVKKNLKKAENGGRDLKEALKFLAKQKGKKGGKKKGKKRR